MEDIGPFRIREWIQPNAVGLGMFLMPQGLATVN